jgi:hypothetical protein
MSRWTTRRLERLYRRYNKIYWEGELPRYYVLPGKLKNNTREAILGEFHYARPLIVINVDAHKRDTKIRCTLLHEMAHVVVSGRGHEREFLSEMERLLQRGAPVFHDEIFRQKRLNEIPLVFPLCRKAVERAKRVELRRVRAVLRGDSQVVGAANCGQRPRKETENHKQCELIWD